VKNFQVATLNSSFEKVDLHGRLWLFVPYDQLTDRVGPLARDDPRSLGIVLIESARKFRRRPYHKQKIALALSCLRHFALEQAARGVAIRHIVTDGPHAPVLDRLTTELGPIRMMEPAERELRAEIEPLVSSGKLEVLPNEFWLTSLDDLRAVSIYGPWRMDRFYAHVRRTRGLLMDGGRPVGGKFSFDVDNRRPWDGLPPAPEPPKFPVDSIKREVAILVRNEFRDHPGEVNIDSLPASRVDADKLWSWAKEQCLPWFGPYEDAMSTSSSGLFHTRISAVLNLGRLTSWELVQDALALNLPIQSREGFIRQIIGWREYVYQVHRATDGFRRLCDGSAMVLDQPGDGGYQRWAGRPWSGQSGSNEPDGGAAPCALGCETPLPPAYWGAKSGLNCLDTVVSDVWKEAYSHHITRLMILANIATLLDVSPRELTDWFWIAYADAYDWVVEPNVLGMGTYAIGDLMTTKSYICGAAYIDKMSDYCRACRFDPKRNCPITSLYWAFLLRHGSVLRSNPRVATVVSSAAKRSPDARRADFQIFRTARDVLVAGGNLADHLT